MSRYSAEPRSILAEPLGSAEPRLKNTGLSNTPVLTMDIQIVLVRRQDRSPIQMIKKIESQELENIILQN
jgi:hypothetical protein